MPCTNKIPGLDLHPNQILQFYGNCWLPFGSFGRPIFAKETIKIVVARAHQKP